jgi:osmoprotectant transport system permease protein
VIAEVFDIGWVLDHLDDVGSALWEHVQLTVLAVAIGLAISFPVAVFAYRRRVAYAPVTWVAGILYTIPSLALFAFLVPYTKLSYLTAEIGLVSYTLLILIRNIVAGLSGVPADVREAARGMGYTDRQMLWKVDLPLAMPVILAGIRIATVTTIGLVTVTSLIGLGGVGYFMLLGIRRFFSTASLLGAVLSVGLALLADWLLVRAGRVLTPWSKERSALGSRAGATARSAA